MKKVAPIILYLAMVVIVFFLLKSPTFPSTKTETVGTTRISYINDELYPTKEIMNSAVSYTQANIPENYYPKSVSVLVADPLAIGELYSRVFLQNSGGYYDQTSDTIVIRGDVALSLMKSWQDNQPAINVMSGLLTHETSHAARFSQPESPEYKSFLKATKWESGFPSLLPYYILKQETGQIKQSTYGLTNPDEDIATTIDNYIRTPNALDNTRQTWARNIIKEDHSKSIVPGFSMLYSTQIEPKTTIYTVMYPAEHINMKPAKEEVISFYTNYCYSLPSFSENKALAMFNNCKGNTAILKLHDTYFTFEIHEK